MWICRKSGSFDWFWVDVFSEPTVETGTAGAVSEPGLLVFFLAPPLGLGFVFVELAI